MTYIKQYGAKRTCTNYTKWLLQENFVGVEVLSEVLGWKHGPHLEEVDWTGRDWCDPKHPRKEKEAERRLAIAMVTDELKSAVLEGGLRYAISVKNPYAWYASIMRYIKLMPGRSSEEPGELIELWNALYENWYGLTLRNRFAIIVRHEDLVTDFEPTLDRIAERLELTKKPGGYIGNASRMANMSDTNWQQSRIAGEKFDSDYYTERRYLEGFDDVLLLQFRQGLSAPLMGAFGYEVL